MHARSAQGLDDVRVTAIAAATPEEAAPIAEEVRARSYPEEEHGYTMAPDEAARLRTLLAEL